MRRTFRHVNSSNWATIFSVLILAAAALSLVFSSRELSAAIKTQEVSVTAQAQAGAPLTLRITHVTPSDTKAPEFSYEVLNTSPQAVSAYAIRHDVTVGKSQTRGIMLTSMRSGDSLLYQQARVEENFTGVTYAAEVSKVILSVDFVEFEDGTMWGADTFKMSEKLAGRRAGGKAALDKLRQLSKTRGLKVVVDSLEENMEVAAPALESELWKEGFDEGVRIVQVTLKHAQRTKGVGALEQELSKPFDISERRQER